MTLATRPAEIDARKHWARRYAAALAFAAAALAIRWALEPVVGGQLPFATFFAAIALATWFCGVAPAVLDAVLLYVAAYVLFFAPRYDGALSPPLVAGYVAYVLAAAVVILGTARLRALNDERRRTLERAVESERQARLELAQRAQAEEALRETQRLLTEADRRKDEFLATLAHELRNPLAPIRNAVRFLELKGNDDPSLQNARELIERQVRHMVRLVDDLLDVSRVTLGQIHLHKEVVSLDIVLTNAIEAARPLIDACRHTLSVSLPRSVYVDGDVTRLTQVFQNLLDNAAKYTPPAGRIEVGAETTPESVRVFVRDNGIGLRADVLDKVFVMFAQIEDAESSRQGGLGIGLALAQRLARMHGGDITVASAGEGRGSEFVVTLPTCAPPAHAHAREDAAQRTRGARRRVLIVDDNVDAAESLRLIINAHGHEAKAAFDGESALSVAERFRPEIVFLDLGMPKMDGYAVCRALRGEPWGDGVTIVALTGWGQEDDRSRTAAAGFDEHLVKPADPEVVERLIAETGGRAATLH